MRAVWRSFLLVLGILCAAAGAAPPAVANSKYAAVVVHADSGDLLFDRNADAARYPASLTKMMTLYLLFEELDAGRLTLASELTVSAQAAAQPPSKLGLTAGSTIDVESAIEALVVKSANDAAVVVAESIAGSEWRFAQKMTEKARALGMSRTTFRNASGLPNSKQKTTARDLATLGRRLAHDYPQYYPYFATRSFTWNGKTYQTHNAVIRTFEGAEGLKTGYTRVSGFNLATSASRDGARLIGVVLGGRSVATRDSHMRAILGGAFAELKRNPTLIASLHRATPTPRLKPTLLAQLERERAIPTVAGNTDMRQEIMTVADSFAQPSAESNDTIGLLAATALQGDLNEHERTRLGFFAANADENWGEGEGDADAAADSAWSVQIGAYSSKALAQSELEEAAAAADLRDRARSVKSLPSADGDALYRARFTALSAHEADKICAALQASKRSCFVVSEPVVQ